MEEKTWIDILSALLTPSIAVIAVYIAWQQWNTAEKKRKQDLFDKRYAFFKLMWKFYEGHIIDPDKVPAVDEEHILDYCFEAEFLFGKDIVKHLMEMPKKQAEMHIDYDWFGEPFRKYLTLA